MLTLTRIIYTIIPVYFGMRMVFDYIIGCTNLDSQSKKNSLQNMCLLFASICAIKFFYGNESVWSSVKTINFSSLCDIVSFLMIFVLIIFWIADIVNIYKKRKNCK